MVQNKLHYATHGHTVAEVIYERVDASQPFMGLKSFSGDFPVLKDISIAKNYLNDEELKILNNIVSGYFDFAEVLQGTGTIRIVDRENMFLHKGYPWIHCG